MPINFGLPLLSKELIEQAARKRTYVVRIVYASLLFVTTLQMGTVALLCAAYFRTTVGAFIGSYLLSLALMFGPALALLIAQSLGFDASTFLNSFVGGSRIAFAPVIVLPLCGFA